MTDVVVIDNAVFGDSEDIDAFFSTINNLAAVKTIIASNVVNLDIEALISSLVQKYCNLSKFIAFKNDAFNTDFVQNVLSVLKSQIKLRHFAVVSAKGSGIGITYPNNVVNIEKYVNADMAKAVHWVLSGFGKDLCMKSNTWFWADPHFNHMNIIKYCNRPFAGVDEMNEALIENYNSVVGANDDVWCLGDFCFGPKDNLAKIVSRLNGKIRLVKGNHDRHKNKVYLDAGFRWVYDRPVLVDDYIVLSHAPLEFLNENSPFFNIAGHVHDSGVYQTFSRSHCIACVERHGYKPISLKEIKEKVNALHRV